MAKRLIGSICLTDIPKQYITTSRNGKKYINITVWENERPSPRGESHSIQIYMTQAQREQDSRKYYIGNLKDPSVQAPPAPANSYRQSAPAPAPQPAVETKEDNNDLPF